MARILLVRLSFSALLMWSVTAEAGDRNSAVGKAVDRTAENPAVAFERRALEKGAAGESERLNAAKIYLERSRGSGAFLIDAQRNVDAVLAENPDSSEGLLLGGHIAKSKGEFAQAARYYRHAASVDPRNPEIYLVLGESLQRLGDEAAADIAYEKFRALRGMAPLSSSK